MKIDYKKKILLSEETTNQEVEYAIKDASLQLQGDILESEKSLNSKKNILKDLKNTYPLDTQAIVDVTNDIECLERGIKLLNELKEELGL